MSASRLPIFDETVQLTNLWLNELMEAVDWDDKQRAYRLLRATLHALRDRLSAQAAVHLGAQLPMLVRGFYYDGWHMRDTILKERTKGEFLSHIEAAFEQDSNVDTEELVREVFKLLARRISSGEIADVKAMLPPGNKGALARCGERGSEGRLTEARAAQREKGASCSMNLIQMKRGLLQRSRKLRGSSAMNCSAMSLKGTSTRCGQDAASTIQPQGSDLSRFQ